MATMVQDFFSDEADFEAVVDEAEMSVINGDDLDFVEDLREQFRESGMTMELTEAVYDRLFALALQS